MPEVKCLWHFSMRYAILHSGYYTRRESYGVLRKMCPDPSVDHWMVFDRAGWTMGNKRNYLCYSRTVWWDGDRFLWRSTAHCCYLPCDSSWIFYHSLAGAPVEEQRSQKYGGWPGDESVFACKNLKPESFICIRIRSTPQKISYRLLLHDADL